MRNLIERLCVVLMGLAMILTTGKVSESKQHCTGFRRSAFHQPWEQPPCIRATAQIHARESEDILVNT